MKRTIYDTNTGTIIVSRAMSDDILSRRLTENPDHGSLDIGVSNINAKQINLETLEVEDKVITVALALIPLLKAVPDPKAVYTSTKFSLILVPPALSVSPLPSLGAVPVSKAWYAISLPYFYYL